MAPPITIANPGTTGGSGGAKPKASVKQALSPTEIARRQGIASQQRNDALGLSNPNPGRANAYYQPGQTSSAAGTNPRAAVSSGNVGGTAGQSLVSGPPANSVSLAQANAYNDLAAIGGPQGQINLAAVNNLPGTQNASSGLPANGTDFANWTFDGSGTAYSPRDLETILNDPYAFQRQFLQSRGMNTSGANAALGQFASRLNPLSMILGGANLAPGEQGNLEAIAELYEGLLSNYTTPGGRMPDVGEIMAILAGVGNIENGGSPTSLLQALYAGEDPEGQVSAFQQSVGAALAGMPGLWGRGWSNMIDQAGTSYLDSTMDANSGPNASFLDYLRNDPFFSRVR